MERKSPARPRSATTRHPALEPEGHGAAFRDLRNIVDDVTLTLCVKADAASGIVNDANRYANETVRDPAYPFNLFRRVITVSLETMRIVRGLPALHILEPTS